MEISKEDQASEVHPALAAAGQGKTGTDADRPSQGQNALGGTPLETEGARNDSNSLSAPKLGAALQA